MPESPVVWCFGEVLWDCLPKGLFLGGAPLNVAYHLKQLGVHAVPISSVGNDFLGKEALRRLRLWNLDCTGIRVADDRPTGVVTAELNAAGNASYSIMENVAWDDIQVPPSAEASSVKAIVFGSLAQRSAQNRTALGELLAACPRALKVFDVNFRPPFDSESLAWEGVASADLIKLNLDEAGRLTTSLSPDPEKCARLIAERAPAALVCITAGAQGAGLLSENEWFWENGREIKVEDTVGAGDSFLASLVEGVIGKSMQPPVLLQRSCRLAEFVAGNQGAQPRHPENPPWAPRG